MIKVAQVWIERGRSEGQTGIVLRQLELRFAAVSRKRVRHGRVSELEDRAEAVLGFTKQVIAQRVAADTVHALHLQNAQFRNTALSRAAII